MQQDTQIIAIALSWDYPGSNGESLADRYYERGTRHEQIQCLKLLAEWAHAEPEEFEKAMEESPRA